MPKPEKIILVCTNARPPAHPKGSCMHEGAGDLLTSFKSERDIRGLKGKISVAGTSCLGPCHLGPVVCVMPENACYKGVKTGDIKDIFNAHTTGTGPVERLEILPEEWD